MTSRDELKALVDAYCDPRIEEVEWVSPYGRARWDYLSQRCVALANDDWAAKLRDALEGFEGDIDFEVALPMEMRYLSGPFGSGSWYWTEADAAVFAMLHERGAAFSFPKPRDDVGSAGGNGADALRDGIVYGTRDVHMPVTVRGAKAMGNKSASHGGRVAYDNGKLVEFFAYCPPGVAEMAFRDHGVKLEDLDFSIPDVERLLKVSGNAHAFRWVRENRPEAIDMARFPLADLFTTSLLEPLLEYAEDVSVRDYEIVEAALARVKALVGAGDCATALQIVKKLNLREAQIVDFLDYVEAHGGYGNQEDAGFSVDERQGPEGGIPSRASDELDAYLRQCASMLREARKPQRLPNGSRATSLPWTEELADEFLAFARKGYVSTMAEFLENVGDGCLPGSRLYGTAQGETRNASNVDALRARRALWEACVSRLDVPLLHFLQQKGLDLAAATMVQEGTWRTCTLIDDVACAYDNGRAHSSAQARTFVIAVLDAGVCLRGSGSRDIMQVFSMFPQDEELFALLADAGFSFHVPDGHGGRGSADASVVRYLMSPFCASVTAARNRARTFEHKAQDWADVAYMLCHGATLHLDCHHAEEVRREFRQHPAEFAALAKTVPPQAMVPMATVMGLLLPSGESVVLEVLAGWKDAFDADILTTTVDVCSRLGMTEATAYLLDMRDAIFGEDSGLSLEL